ncbi:MAG TPA: hypothetical protein VK277_00580 [Acidimicrobiales bacterium]|nr:hypothetical protein [Acidimicrobiales bacterium]
MAQPSFVPITDADQVRPALQLRAPGSWQADRPAELQLPRGPSARRRGTPGPDQGYALRLARRFEDRLVLTEGEAADDVLVGCALLASRRSALLGRAPAVYDLEVAFGLFGYLAAAPSDLVAFRAAGFRGAAHDYDLQRELVDRVPESALLLSPDEIAGSAARWPSFLDRGAEAAAPAPTT